MSNNPAVDRFHHEAGKGAVPRPVDHEKYKANWDLIFAKKKEQTHASTSSSEKR